MVKRGRNRKRKQTKGENGGKVTQKERNEKR
jgi:hypothetical protein